METRAHEVKATLSYMADRENLPVFCSRTCLINILTTPHQGNFSLKQEETITENHSQPELWSPVPMAASRKQLPHLRPRKHCARCHRIVRARVKHDKHSEREREFAMRWWSSSNVGSYTHEPHRHDYPNMSWARTKTLWVQSGWRKAHKVSALHKELQGIKEYWKQKK